jgi:hypothetical protein
MHQLIKLWLLELAQISFLFCWKLDLLILFLEAWHNNGHSLLFLILRSKASGCLCHNLYTKLD